MRIYPPMGEPIGLGIDSQKMGDKHGYTEALGGLRNEIERRMTEQEIKDEVIQSILSKIDDAATELLRFFPLRPKKPIKVHIPKKEIQEVLFTDPKEIQDSLFK